VAFGAMLYTRADTNSSPVDTMRIAPSTPVCPKRLCAAFSYTFVCPGAIVSVAVAGFVLLWPVRKKRNSYDTVDEVGFVTQTVVVKRPFAPWTWPAAGTIRSVPVKPFGCFSAAKREEQTRTTATTNAATRLCSMATPFGVVRLWAKVNGKPTLPGAKAAERQCCFDARRRSGGRAEAEANDWCN
jgi:hypothetical protein